MKKFESNPTPELAGMLADYFEAQNDMKQAYTYLKKVKKLSKIARPTLTIKSSMLCIPVFAQKNCQRINTTVKSAQRKSLLLFPHGAVVTKSTARCRIANVFKRTGATP
ncbi:MAG: hypothetical protein J7L94_08640 [Caldisericaceae bacterium]|nr:hypothetical protein [Caldisericaceae bacterium]